MDTLELKDELLAEMEALTKKDSMSEQDKEDFENKKVIVESINRKMGLGSAGRKAGGKDQPYGGQQFASSISAGRPTQSNSRCFKNPKDALAFGKLLAGAKGDMASLEWLNNNGYGAVHTEGVNAAGGWLVPEILGNQVINYQDEHGVARRNCYVRPMTSDVLNIPRRSGSLTSYWTGETVNSTESTLTVDNVKLSAKKLACLTRLSNELIQDSIIDVAQFIAEQIAWSFSEKEDSCCFVGDGTSTYGGMTGVVQKLLDVNTVAGGAGLIMASGNEWSEIVLNDIMKLAAGPAGYAFKAGCKWYCSRAFYQAVLVRLIAGAGGVTMQDLTEGVAERKFLGYPIEFVECMTRTDANSSVPLLFGSMSQATSFGDRRLLSIESSPTAIVNGEDSFSRDLIAIRGTERWDFVAHDVGTNSLSGPICGLLMAAA
jgi:HK97 family phage major capsid protein